VAGDDQGNSPDDVAHQQVPPQPNMPRNNGIAPGYAGLTPEQQQQMVYQQYMQQQQQGVAGNYPMPPQVSSISPLAAIRGRSPTSLTDHPSPVGVIPQLSPSQGSPRDEQ